MSNIVSLKAVREIRKAKECDPAYQAKILGMQKIELLEEMMKFQEERTQTGHLTADMMIRGQVLFRALEEIAETEELRALTHSYRKHLKFELDNYLKAQSTIKEIV